MTEADSFCRVITCDRPRDTGEYCAAHQPAEAEAKAIEWTDRHHVKWRLHKHSGVHVVTPGATEADLLSAGYVPASLLLAVEAELGRMKAGLKKLAESWMSNAGTLRLEGARHETYEILEACSDELLTAAAAPPSPPVAPEPAQENSPGMGGGELPAPVPVNGDVPPVVENTGGLRAEPAQESQDTPCLPIQSSPSPSNASSEHGATAGTDTLGSTSSASGSAGIPMAPGSAEPAQEAGGVERVSHDQARAVVAGNTREHARPDLARYIDQQEQSEREAAGLRASRDRYIQEAMDMGADLDAERTQKERLRTERDTAETNFAKACRSIDGLRTENEGLLFALHLIAGTHGEETSSPRACAATAIARWSRAQQPAEAAPVEPTCGCARCQRLQLGPLRVFMSLCPKCGNKRCPKAEWHDFQCSGSNETGQVGVEECKLPAEAAPVAKRPLLPAPPECTKCGAIDGQCATRGCLTMEEKASGPAPAAKAEAPSEPAGWEPKVGDKVRVKPGGSGSCEWKTGSHEVSRTDASGSVWLLFQDDPHGEAGDWHASELELVEPAPQPPATAETVSEPSKWADSADFHLRKVRPDEPGRDDTVDSALWCIVGFMRDVARLIATPPGLESPPDARHVPVYLSNDGQSLAFPGGGFTAVRACRHCGALIAGGPTACMPCAAREGTKIP